MKSILKFHHLSQWLAAIARLTALTVRQMPPFVRPHLTH
jgi:hypothetical protein